MLDAKYTAQGLQLLTHTLPLVKFCFWRGNAVPLAYPTTVGGLDAWARPHTPLESLLRELTALPQTL